jgi:hypothetical protein
MIKYKLLCCLILMILPLFVSAQCKDPRAPGQKEAFNTLTDQGKSDLFVAHLIRERDRRALNKSQRDTIDLGITLATPEFYAAKGKLTKEQTAKFTDLKRRMRAYFSGRSGSEIFEQIREYQPVGASARLLAGDCNCSTRWTYCWDGSCRVTPAAACPGVDACSQVYNCGPFWGFLCNGMCCGTTNES